MTIRNWHVGKIVLLWVWGIALCAVIIQILSKITNFVWGFIFIGALVAVLIVLSVVTWKWFSGKEKG